MLFHYKHSSISCIFLQYLLIDTYAIYIPKDLSDLGLSENPACPPNNFKCADGTCIPQLTRCDYNIDCVDGSDELDCPKENCTKNEFACDTNTCIPKRYLCDGENDCNNGADERDCYKPVNCTFDQFRCLGNHVCIPGAWRCDFENDCKDGSDELNCSIKVCADHEYSCGAPRFHCIHALWVCDGDTDCPGGVDEKNCTTIITTTIPPPPNPFLPKNKTCHDWMFTCNNKKCIPKWWKCDEYDDCGDNSDEIYCGAQLPNTNLSTTAHPQYAKCQSKEYQCATSGTCIPLSWVCDGERDCPGGIDEENCAPTTTTTISPPLNPFSPKNGTICDGWMFTCNNKKCIPYWWKCDENDDCGDNSDEMDCPPRPSTFRPNTWIFYH